MCSLPFPLTGAHIHEAPAGIAGPIIVDFSGQLNGTGLADLNLADVLANPTNHYVNLHNADFPAGAIRGQLGAPIPVPSALGLVVLMDIRGDFGPLFALSPGNWLLLVLSAIIGIAVSHVLLYRALAGLGALVTSGAGLVQPFLTWLGAALLLGEQISSLQFAGGLIIVAGAFLLILAESRVSGE